MVKKGSRGLKYIKNSVQSFNRYDLILENEERQKRTFSDNTLLQQVALQVVNGDEEGIKKAVPDALIQTAPKDVIDKGLITGMNEVSRLWGEGSYFLPQVILSSDAMLAGIELCEKKMGQSSEKKGLIITHTAEGDIHDIGQMIVNALLSAAGYEVLNLGVDVPVDEVVRACLEYRPIMLTGTALMTTTMSAFPRIAAKLKQLNLQIPFVCGGGAVNDEFVNSFDLGIWGKEASWATGLADDALHGMSWQQMRAKWNG